MMKEGQTIGCGVVQDLLPLYAEQMTSAESTALIEAHMQQCHRCRKVAETMKKTIAGAKKPPEKEVDFLKKLRRKNWLTGILTGLCCLAAVVIGLQVHHYYFETAAQPVPAAEIQVLSAEENEDGTVRCRLAAVSEYEVCGFAGSGENGIYYLTMYSVRKPALRTDGNPYAMIAEENIGYSADGVQEDVTEIYYRDGAGTLLPVWSETGQYTRQ